MIPLKVPDWWDSIRAIIALILVLAVCFYTGNKEVSKEKYEGLIKLAEFAVVFYFVLKKRKEGD